MTHPTPFQATPHGPGLLLEELVGELLGLEPKLEGNGATRIRGVRQDSRQVEVGELFVARAGASSSALAHVPQALERGAAAVLLEYGVDTASIGVPVLRVTDARRALGLCAEAVYGFPSRALPVVGVTGTNGKTTTTWLVEQALRALGARPARLGTLGFSFDGTEEVSLHTTPEADEVSRRLALVLGQGATHFVMEVSSHALELGRVTALAFDVGAFSNLTQDHLDFHGSMQHYGAAKARLFQELLPRASVFNLDDAFGRQLYAAQLALQKRSLGVAQHNTEAALRVQHARLDRAGCAASIKYEGGEVELSSRLVGAHNLDNLLLALGILVQLGFEPALAAPALGSAEGVPGRMERCDEGSDDLLVVVDYAHTPDALERALDTLLSIGGGRLHCVFGCGGDRDPKKRPLMGRAVAERAHSAIITNDNPRTEDPTLIAAAISQAFPGLDCPYRVELERAAAIESAMLAAAPGDTVLIAGKGHEDYQIFGRDKVPFDDRVQARNALAKRRQRGQG